MNNKIVQCCLAAGLMMASGFSLADDSFVQQAKTAIAKATAPVTVGWPNPGSGAAAE
jgi:ribose transport system substrate-binding protein